MSTDRTSEVAAGQTPYESTDLPALTVAGHTGWAPSRSEVGGVVGPLFGRLLADLARLGLDTDQPTVAWYDLADDGVSLGVGVPAGEGTDGDGSGLTTATLPGAEQAVVTRHEGTLEGIGAAWAALHQHLSAQGLTAAGTAREVYLAGDPQRPGSWVVDLQQPVVRDA